ncbi:MAG: FGGY family carbohydrate kinase, partial [Solirubrobacterales bacterium]
MSTAPGAIVAVDAGTSALRVLAFDPGGRRLASFSRPNEIHREVDGTAEADPLLWAAALRDGLREVVEQLDGAHEVTAIAIT